MTGTGSSSRPGPERRQLSADDTESAKALGVLSGVVFTMALTLVAVLRQRVPLHLLLLAPVLALGIWWRLRMKEVETDGRSLFVSTMFRTMRVPLTLVESVSQGGWAFTATVTVVFRQVTPFGAKIVFRPLGGWGVFSGGGDIADELRVLVRRVESERPPGSTSGARDSHQESGPESGATQ